MSFSEKWLTGEEIPPTNMLPTVELCRTFMGSNSDSALLKAIASMPKDACIALAIVLAKRGDGDRIETLKSVRSIRKTIGKELHRLRSDGCEWSSSAGTKGTKGTITYASDPVPSYLSGAHPSGSRFLILCGHHPNGSMAAIYGLASETDGLSNFVAIPHVSRTKIKKLIDEVERMHSGRTKRFLVEADPVLVRTRFRQAVHIHRRLGKPFPDDYHSFSDLIRGPVFEEEHPARTLVPKSDSDWLHRGPELFGSVDKTTDPPSYHMGAVDRPIMDRAWTKMTQQRLQNAMSSPVLISDVQRKDHVLAELDRIIVETFDEPFRIRMADRMLDAGYVLWKQNEVALAHVAMATADALLSTSTSPLDIPWVKESIAGIFDADGFVETFSPDQNSSEDTTKEKGLIIPG